MQLGFVIDHSRCIGCHACTVACKAENDVPLGSFRTWVKYTEHGAFPDVRRSFAVLRCNQCSDAPCVEICPVRALDKRPDGIVDVDPAACIGCKACMQGCPYDALYINDATGTAEKCHFCAHRAEVSLAPACAVVCPTEAIVPGDFHDPQSRVSELRRRHDLMARKVEAGTGPNVLYREVAAPGIDPLQTGAAGGYLWANQVPGLQMDAERFLAGQREADAHSRARTTYDVEHATWWGGKVSGYLFTKSLAAGSFLVVGPLMLFLARARELTVLSTAALLFLAITTLLLVADLRRPERFLYILVRPNWSSWLARGALVLIGYGAVVPLFLVVLWWSGGGSPVPWALWGVGAVLAALTAAYTGWLFGQARGRVLWMRRGLWLHLIVQAWLAGVALASLLGPWLDLSPARREVLRGSLALGLSLHLIFVLGEPWMAPRGRRAEYRRAMSLIHAGPFALRHWLLGVGVGIVVPAVVLLLPLPAWSLGAAALAVLIGLWVEEDVLVRAGQALPIS